MENVLKLKRDRDFSASFLEDWKSLGPMFEQCKELEGTELERHKRGLDDLVSTLARRAHRMQGLLNTRSRVAMKLPVSWTWVQNYEVITNAILLLSGPQHERWEFWHIYPKSTTLLEMYVGYLDDELEGWRWKAFNPLYWLRFFISVIVRELLTAAFSLLKVSGLTVERVMNSTLYKILEILAAIGGAIGFVYLVYLGGRYLAHLFAAG